MKISIACIAFAFSLFVLNAQDMPPTFSETFMANLTIHTHNPNSTGDRGWITQDGQKQMFAVTFEIPRNDRMPQGAIYREVRYPSRVYIFLSHEPDKCECRYIGFEDYWWWVPDAKKTDEPPPTKNLDCWEEGQGQGRGSPTVCVDPKTPTIPDREFRFQLNPNIHYIEFSQYVPGKVNTTMFTNIPQSCPSNCP